MKGIISAIVFWLTGKFGRFGTRAGNGLLGRAFRFMLATGQRQTEVGAATWGEIDNSRALWTLSRARTKAKRLHDVPLSAFALAILEDCPKTGDFIFASGRSGNARDGHAAGPVALAGWSKAKERLDELMLKHATDLADGEAVKEIEEWRLHDLRRTCATHMARLGVDRVVIGKVLNHAARNSRQYWNIGAGNTGAISILSP